MGIVVNHRKNRTFESNSQPFNVVYMYPTVVNHRKNRTFESNSQQTALSGRTDIVVNHRKTRTFESNSQHRVGKRINRVCCKSS